MNTLITIALILGFTTCLEAKDYKDMSETELGAVDTILASGTYDQKLEVVKAAFQQSQGSVDTIAEIVFLKALNSVNDQVKLALDFSLQQSDMNLKSQAAGAIYKGLLNNSVDAPTKEIINTRLSAEVAVPIPQSQDSYDFVRNVAYGLLLLGNDIGLDIILTSQETTRNYSVKDNWNATSDAATFQQLEALYEQKASDPAVPRPGTYKIKAAIYGLCKTRRMQGKNIQSLQPPVNLDQLRSR